MERYFEDFLSNLNSAMDDDEAWQVICRAAADLGFDKVIYLYSPNSEAEPMQRTTYSDSWMVYWNDREYYNIDIPVRKTAESGFNPLRLDVDAYLNTPNLSEDAAAIEALWEAKNEGGCGKVYSHQLFQGQKGSGAMGFISEHLDSRCFQSIITKKSSLLSSIIHIGHARLCQSMIENTKTPVPMLSGRQKDVLSCLADGLQYKQIAYKLGISENTVAYHIKQLTKKVGGLNSRDILSKSYRLGLLSTL